MKEIKGEFVGVGCKKCDEPLTPVTEPKKTGLSTHQEYKCEKCGYTVIVSVFKDFLRK